MNVRGTELPGVLLLEPDAHADARGALWEAWRDERYRALGIGPFVQDNFSRSGPGVLRGLHFQAPGAQGKLVQVLEGEVLDVVVDVRRGSPSFGRWTAVQLEAGPPRQVWVPPGFAHGLCVAGESALVFYKLTAPWRPEDERVIAWDDPDLGIPWPLERPVLSARDAAAPRLRDATVLPRWTDG